MHAVKVVDSGNERPGAACSETLESYMEKKFRDMLDEKLKPLQDEVEKLKPVQDEVTKLKGQVHHLESRLSESAALYNKQNEKIASQGKCIQYLERRTQDLTYDRSAIDEIVANSAVAMCPLCNEQRKSIICLPCAHTFCGECLKPSGSYHDDLFCPICYGGHPWEKIASLIWIDVGTLDDMIWDTYESQGDPYRVEPITTYF